MTPRPSPAAEPAGAHAVDIREATVTDIPAIFAVRTSVTENRLTLAQLAERGVTADSMAAQLATPETRTWIAESRRGARRDTPHAAQPEVVAFATADARSGAVFALFVHPAAERRGIGRALLEVAERWLFAAGRDAIWLTTDRAPHCRAHRLYRAAGWTLAGPADHGDVRYEKRRTP